MVFCFLFWGGSVPNFDCAMIDVCTVRGYRSPFFVFVFAGGSETTAAAAAAAAPREQVPRGG